MAKTDQSHLDTVESPLAEAKFNPTEVHVPRNKLGVDMRMFDRTGARRRTQSLFEEAMMYKDNSETAVYSLKLQSKLGLPSLEQLYLDLADPTEYEFAIEAFGSWDYWIDILGGNQNGPHPAYIREHIDRWRKTLAIKLRSEGIKALRKNIMKPNAALWFAEGNFETAKQNKRGPGRPTNEEVQREIEVARQALQAADEEARRLGL